MRLRISFTLVFLLAGVSLARAQDPPTIPAPTDLVDIGRSALDGKLYGAVEFGGRVTQISGDQARFQRYRDLRPGLFGTNGVAGRRTEDYWFEAQAWNVGYRDQKYQVDLGRTGKISGKFLWDQIPMFISADTRTLFEYTVTAPNVFRIEDAIQQDIQSGAKTLRNFEDQAERFDLRTVRKIGSADIAFHANRSTDIMLSVKNQDRKGAIPFGGTFGFNNAVELPAPVDWRITDIKTSLEWANNKGLVNVGWDGSAFHNDIESVTWDNPLRFGPDLAATPSQGRFASWPSNTLMYLHGMGAVSFAGRSRLTGYLSVGQGRSNETLLPFTINTAIAPVPLSRPTAEGKQQTTIAQVTYAARPAARLALNAKYRYADVDVQTPEFTRPGGTVQYDSSFAAVAGPSEYHSVKRATFDVDGAFEIAPKTSLKVGFSDLVTDYTHRIFEKTDEQAFRVSIDTTGNQYFMVRGQFEDRERRGEGFEAEALAEAGELPGMRHYDVADRDRQRFTLIANVMPGGMVGFTASAGVGRDKYPDSENGLQTYDTDQYSAGVTLAPDDRYNFTGSYGWERYRSLQRSRYATSAAEQLLPIRNWTTDYTGKVNFFEAALDIDRAIEKTSIRLSADWNKSNDTYLYGLVAGSPLATPEQLPAVKNEMLRAQVDVVYEIAKNLRFGVGYWFDDYNVDDFALGPTTLSGIALPQIQPGGPVVATNALLLGYLYRPYTAHAGFIRLTYAF